MACQARGIHPQIPYAATPLAEQCPANPVLISASALRSLEVHSTHEIDFAEAYLVASAESADLRDIFSFDRSIDRVPTVNRIEP